MRILLAAAMLAIAFPAAAQEAPSDWMTSVGLGEVVPPDDERLAKWDWNQTITPADIPADLRARSFRTETRLSVDVGSDGKSTACRVTGASADPRLDAVVCDRVRARASFSPAYAAPGRPLARTLDAVVRWENATRRELDERREPPRSAPLPLAMQPGYSLWPRLYWEGGVRIDRYPDLRPVYAAAVPGGEVSNATSVDLTIWASTGSIECRVAIPSGNAALDAAACATARALPLSYPEPCARCELRHLPLRFVWAPGGGYIRVPLAVQGKPPGMARDPADPRAAPPVPRLARPQPVAMTAADFTDIADKRYTEPRPEFRLFFDGEGRVVSCFNGLTSGNDAIDERICTLLKARARYAPLIDVFGDARSSTHYRAVDLGTVLPLR